MQSTLSKHQERELESYIKDITLKIEEDDYAPTAYDKFLMAFVPVKRGIRKHGYTINELANIFGVNANNHKELCYLRTEACMFVGSLVSDGKPFGSLRDGKYKRYGWAFGHEIEEILWDRKKRHIAETHACMKYLNNEDPYKKICSGIVKEYDKQMKFLGFDEIA